MREIKLDFLFTIFMSTFAEKFITTPFMSRNDITFPTRASLCSDRMLFGSDAFKPIELYEFSNAKFPLFVASIRTCNVFYVCVEQ